MVEQVPEIPPAEQANPEEDITFPLSPAQVSDRYIDYAMKVGESIWRQATAKLAEEQFDCTTDGLRDFLQQVQRRSEIMGWDNSILAIPKIKDEPLGKTNDFFALW